jgi:hypothetical protein
MSCSIVTAEMLWRPPQQFGRPGARLPPGCSRAGLPLGLEGPVTILRRRLQFALKPASHIFGFERVGAVAIETL